MHRHRAMYHGFHAPYPYHHHHYGMNDCSPYENFDPLPDVHACAPLCHQDYPYRRTVPCMDYPYYDYLPRVLPPRPPIVQTNVRNDVSYYLDEPYPVYDDDYGQPYRSSRPKLQLVDFEARHRPPRNTNRMMVSTFQPRERREPERVLVPRNLSMPSHDRQRRMKLVPLYHSADPQYPQARQRRSVVREIVPVATVADSHPNRQTIRVRSLSPM